MATISHLIDVGQQFWLEGLAREHKTNRLLIEEERGRTVAGLTVDIDACARALQTGTLYDPMVRDKLKEGAYGERLAMAMLIDDARYAADLLQTIFQRTNGRDGWVVLPVSPLLMSDLVEMAESVAMLQTEVQRANILVSIPGLSNRLPVIEKLMGSGIPLHIGLIFSPLQLRAVTQTCLEAIEARIAAGHGKLPPCFVSIPVDRLLAGLGNLLPEGAAIEFGIGVIAEIAETARNQFSSRRWARAMSAGAPSPRLIWSFGQNGGRYRSSFLFVKGLEGMCAVSALTGDPVSPLSLHELGERERRMSGNEQRPASLRPAHDDIDFATFAERLQNDEADSLLQSWIGLLDSIARKSATLTITQ